MVIKRIDIKICLMMNKSPTLITNQQEKRNKNNYNNYNINGYNNNNIN